MSNSSIAVYPKTTAQDVVGRLTQINPDWRLSVNARKFDYDADILIASHAHSVAVWASGNARGQDHELQTEIGRHSSHPWLRILFQDHVAWEYLLYQNGLVIDRFMPLPSMWGLDKPELGQPSLLASIWGVPEKTISKYLREWNAKTRGRKAFWWRDQWKFGQFEQGFDFLRALTGIEFPS
ncbi:hypothetical protein [Prosthecobacter sp.]|uniref:hypothetical protein n=1 Tax=Prosthecobacter sp. TaxID=1965333 RepID=UPI002ABB23F5|nr:hypothetical protein [Prosthecobacter sp.]MDZ4403095.1 hypothetical protein [Prosthecobacter sp.]